jgi:D-alanine-D-alanine ligase
VKLTVAVIQGGPSSEAEVSRASAKSVAKALETSGHRVLRLELDGYLAESLRSNGTEVAFPVSHGAVGEDGSLQGLLECLDLPYVGSNVLASALAMNKRVAKVMFAEAGLPIARGVSLVRGQGDAKQAAERALRELGEKVVVKPCSSGSAIGVTRFDGGAPAAELEKAIDAAWSLDAVVLVEKFAPGREGTCGVLDLHGKDPRALSPTEIRAAQDAFYTYQARYAPGRSEHLCPPPWDEAVVRRVQEVAVAAHRALGCRDLSRVDFVVGDRPEDVVLLEVNTMPGFTDTSLYPEAAGISGIPMPELCHALALSAKQRGSTPRNQAIPLPR